MATRTSRIFVVGSALGASTFAAALVGACSASTGPAPGAVMVSIDTNMKVPDDIDQVGISASLANVDGGTVWTDSVFDLKPATNSVFPATFAVVRGTDEPVAIRVVGYKAGVPLTLRDAIVTLPPDRTAVLRMPLDWLDKGSATAATTTKDLSTGDAGNAVHVPTPQELQSTCGAAQTSIAGACTAVVAQTSLPDFVASAFPSSTDLSACLDMNACFPAFDTGALDVKVDKATCSFTSTIASTSLNVAIRLGPVGNGWGNGYGHVMPIGQDSTDGWHLGSDGSIVLRRPFVAIRRSRA